MKLSYGYRQRRRSIPFHFVNGSPSQIRKTIVEPIAYQQPKKTAKKDGLLKRLLSQFFHILNIIKNYAKTIRIVK